MGRRRSAGTTAAECVNERKIGAISRLGDNSKPDYFRRYLNLSSLTPRFLVSIRLFSNIAQKFIIGASVAHWLIARPSRYDNPPYYYTVGLNT